MSKRDELRQAYRAVANAYLKAFEKKHHATLEFWVSDEVGGTAYIGDHYFDFEDIRFDIDNRLPKDMIWEWSDAAIAMYESGERINLYSWSKGLRPGKVRTKAGKCA
jgi:hypothetical protein